MKIRNIELNGKNLQITKPRTI